MKKYYNSNTLKLWAMASMLIDHTGVAFVQNTILYDSETFQMLLVSMRLIGRIAFPLFAFLLVEGFLHTSNVFQYVLRLLMCAVLSEIPFDLALYGRLTFQRQNVCFTLALGLIMMYIMQRIEEKYIAMPRFAAYFTIIVSFSIIAQCLAVDYSFMGIFLIAFLYLLRDNKRKQCIAGVILCSYELTAVFAFPIISRYSGERGKSGISRIAWYVCYPLHLLILWVARSIFTM